MSKGALGMLAAYWPEGLARYSHVPLRRVTEGCIHAPAEADGDRPAAVMDGRRLSYAELSRDVRRVGAALRARATPGTRVAVALDDGLELLVALAGAFEADLLAWPCGAAPDPEALARFGPDLVVSRTPPPGGPPQPTRLGPDELLVGAEEASAPRPRLREPILALASARGGELLHNHKTLLATGIAFGEFFALEPGSETVLLEPPDHWLGLAALLGAWQRGGTVHLAWPGAGALPGTRVDYVVAGLPRAERVLEPVGVAAGLSAARRRRIARRFGAPALTVYGSQALGPVLASHPLWFLADSVGIPLPNVDTRPLDPGDGRELSIGWDAVEEAEMGVKSPLAPAGGELVGGWLRTRELGHVDATGLYFLRGAVPAG
jgi:hypothetical protein